MVHRDFEWSEVSFLSIGLGRVPCGLFIDGVGSSILILLQECNLWLQLLPFIFSSGIAIDWASGRILDLDVLLSPREDVQHLGAKCL